MKTKLTALICSVCVLSACSNESPTTDTLTPSEAATADLALPSSSSEQVLLEGNMTFWMYEGAAGCYGTLLRGSEEIELWTDAETCGEQEYAENAPAAVVVTYRSDEQWGPERSYSIVEFR